MYICIVIVYMYVCILIVYMYICIYIYICISAVERHAFKADTRDLTVGHL